MTFVGGIVHNFKGLWLGLKTPKLLVLGLIRFCVLFFLTIAAIILVLLYHKDIMTLIWTQPESSWLLGLWHLVSWVISLIIMILSGILAYLLAQIFFCVFIMDLMSRTTERLISGSVMEPDQKPWFRQFLHLLRQEVPRAILPILLMLLLAALGWLTPFGPVITVIASLVAVIFLAWDNSDLLPARRALPFNQRFRYLIKNIGFHLGFGLPFLIPFLNILLISFAPIGATIYVLNTLDAGADS